MKKHPLIQELQLGKGVEELVRDNFMELDFQGHAADELPNVVREIVRLNNPDLRFAVGMDTNSCNVFILNGTSGLELDYWDHKYHVADDDNAMTDCDILNGIVESIFGKKRKKAKPKISKEQFSKKNGRICPFCLAENPMVLDDPGPWNNRDRMGCKSCGETWERKYKTIVTGFSR